MIYLDYNATTPVAPVVAGAMDRVLREAFGNASSGHEFGQIARRELETARARVADAIGARPNEIVFTGGGSESNNIAIKGRFLAAMAAGERGRVVSQITEHPSVLEPLRVLEELGADVVRLGVDATGIVSPESIAKAISPETLLVSIQHANNETGTIQPIAEIAATLRPRGIPLHVDAAQSVGKIPVDVDELGVDFLTIAGHKLYGPKGVGVLYVREGSPPLAPMIHGAGHERGFRAGTEAIHQAAGLGEACHLATRGLDCQATGDLDESMARVRRLRDCLFERLAAAVPGLHLNGHETARLPNTLNVSFPGVIGAELLAASAGVAASTGSACHAGEVRLSPVLEAMGVTPEFGAGAVRLSLGKPTRQDDVDEAADLLILAFQRLSGQDSG